MINLVRAVFTITLLCMCGIASSCSCILDSKDDYQAAEYIVVGEIVSTQLLRYRDSVFPSTEARVHVLEVLKGNVQDEITIFDPGAGTSCGMGLREHETWLFHFNKSMQVGQCSGTQMVPTDSSDPKTRADFIRILDRYRWLKRQAKE